MISYIVALHRPDIYEIMAGPNLRRQVAMYGAELILVENAESIYAAYEEGRQRAKHWTKVYVHDDVALVDFDATPRLLMDFKTRKAQLMGVIGARGHKLPWWTNDRLIGGWGDVRRDKRVYWATGGSGTTAAVPYTGAQRPLEPRWLGEEWDDGRVDQLDGIFLAEQGFDAPWPEREAGLWHGYDAERCQQVAAAGGVIKICDIAAIHWIQRHERGHLDKHREIMRELRASHADSTD
jgi:hypothetical protein